MPLWKSTADSYGLIARIFHWGMAVIVIGLIGLGLYMAGLERGPTMIKLYGLHKSIGIVVLGLVFLRVIWCRMDRSVSSHTEQNVAGHKKWERDLARVVHILFYSLLFILPLAGWTMSSAKGYPVSVFGWFTLPELVEKDKELGNLAAEIHRLGAYLMIGLIALHVTGVLKHVLIDRNGTLVRMLGWLPRS